MAMDDDRARRLAAIQARLAPTDVPPPADGGGSGSGSSTPLRGAPRHLPKAWTRPSEKDEREKRRELARVLQRTIVRDSGYTQAATCVEVSELWASVRGAGGASDASSVARRWAWAWGAEPSHAPWRDSTDWMG